MNKKAQRKHAQRVEAYLERANQIALEQSKMLGELVRDGQSSQEAMSYSLGHFANALMEHVEHMDAASQQVVSLLESDDPQTALDKMVGQLGAVVDNLADIKGQSGRQLKNQDQLHKNLDFWLAKTKTELEKVVLQGADRPTFKQQKEALTLLDRLGDRLVDLHTCLDANTAGLSGALSSIDTQMAPVSSAAAQWSRSQVRTGPGIEEFSAASNDLPEPKAPEAPDPTTADSWGGKLGEDIKPSGKPLLIYRSDADTIQREAVSRFEDSVARGVKAEDRPLTNAEDVARQGDPNPPKWVAQTDYAELLEDHNTLIRAHQRLQSDVAKWHDRWEANEGRLKKEAQGHIEWKAEAAQWKQEALDLRKDSVGKIDIAKFNEQAMELTETRERLKIALDDLGGHTEGLPVDASMDHFIKWVGNHGWKWIQGHRGTINERLDRMEREAAYNRGNNVAPPRAIKDNPQA